MAALFASGAPSSIPEAMSSAKSGPYSSASASGPSSGTEKCRTFRMASAIEMAPLLTVSIIPRMPSEKLRPRSPPHVFAFFTSRLISLAASAILPAFVLALDCEDDTPEANLADALDPSPPSSDAMPLTPLCAAFFTTSPAFRASAV